MFFHCLYNVEIIKRYITVKIFSDSLLTSSTLTSANGSFFGEIFNLIREHLPTKGEISRYERGSSHLLLYLSLYKIIKYNFITKRRFLKKQINIYLLIKNNF